MTRVLLIILLSSYTIFNHYAQSQEVSAKGLNQISEPLVKEFIDFFASDEMRGRSVPSVEADKSANYVASKFKDFGLKTVNGSYFQQIPFCSADLNVEQCSFALIKSGTKHEFAIKENFTPLYDTGNSQATGELVFAGYGITAPEYNYDDYKDIDVKGKIVLVMKQEPRQNDTAKTVFNGGRATKYSGLAYKIRNATRHGAAGLLLVTDPLHNFALTAQGHLWNSLYMKGNPNPMYNLCTEKNNNIPAVQVDRDVINVIFGSVDSLRNLQRNIDEVLSPNSFLVPEISTNLAVLLEKDVFPSNNVIGWLEGSDEQLKSEFVVIGAHYDHLGESYRPNNMNDSIMNGADDNASGTAAVMAVAKAFTESGKRPARSVVFMLFTAEERGLIGSDYYTKNPLFSLKKTVAMINLDMVGRNGNDTVYVVGQQYSPELAALVNEEISKSELTKIELRTDLYRSSDNFPFYKNEISAIGLMSGIHEDYHRVTDNPDKINYLKVQRIAQLTYKVAWRVANTKTYYTVIKR